MFKLFSLFLVLVATASFGRLAAAEEGEAFLMVSKILLNSYLVEGRDLTVEYSIYNVGDSVATDVELSDSNFAHEQFTMLAGSTSAKWSRLPPESNVTLVAVVRPLAAGQMNFTSALVTYRPQEDSTELKVVMSSEPGLGVIYSQREFNRQFSAHLFDWIIFAVICTPSIVFPFALWMHSKRKYENVVVGKAKRS